MEPGAREVFKGDGEMAALMREKDWASTPLGPVEGWPQALRTIVRTLLKTRHPMFLWWGPDLIQLYNDAYVPSFGRGKHPRALGQPGRECWPEIWHIIGPQIEDVMLREQPSWHEDQLVPIFRNGKIEDVYWTYGYSPVYDDDGRVGGTLVVCSETTSRVLVGEGLRATAERAREKEAEAQSQRQKLFDLFMQTPVAICVLEGPHHTFTFANPLYRELVGGREVVGKPLLEALPDLRGQGFEDLLSRVVATGQPFFGNEVPIKLAHLTTDQPIFLNFVYAPKRNRDGVVDGVLVAATDVTAQVRGRERERERSDFEQHLIGIVSHDLRDPLTIITMGLAALLRRDDLDARAVKGLLRAQSAADRMGRMVRDLLDFTQARLGGGIPVSPVPLELQSLAIQVLEEVQASYPERDLQILALGGSDGTWDPDRITQVLFNLVTNALKYSPASSPVTVRLLCENAEHVVIEVHNEGPPIPAAAQERLFSPMKRATALTDRASRSVGLGLYIVKEIVEAHAGTVAVDSWEEQGTTFRVRLPRRMPTAS